MIASAKGPTLLEELEKHIAVDCDTTDVDFVKTLPIKPHDMTSNPRFIHEAILDPRNKELVEKSVKELKGRDWKDVYAVITARVAARMIPHISGRVLAQTFPSNAYDTDALVEDARRYAKAYNAEGISNDRFCIKIAVTGPGVRAARILKKEGIATLGTALFGLPQALGACQSGMHAISMYYNLPYYQSDKNLWPDVADPATQHPMSNRHIQIRQSFDKIKSSGKPIPQIKTASFISIREVMGMIELGADHVTLGKPTLEDMLYPQWPSHAKGNHKVPVSEQISKPEFMWEDWKPPVSAETKKRMEEIAKSDPVSGLMEKDFKIADPNLDYVDGDTLDKAIEADEVTRVGLKEGLRRFAEMEDKSKVEIQRLQKELA